MRLGVAGVTAFFSGLSALTLTHGTGPALPPLRPRRPWISGWKKLSRRKLSERKGALMSLRQTAKQLGISPAYLSYMVNGKRPWRSDMKERYEELVNTVTLVARMLTGGQTLRATLSVTRCLPPTPISRWREREGVEPTAPTEGPGPTDLKSAKPTRTHPLPCRYQSTWIQGIRPL